MNSQSKRITYVDFMKSIGMLIIMWGHIMLFGPTNTVAYAFHIPLFFFLSGLMFKKDKYPDFREFFKRRVKSLLIPYAIFSVVFWIIWLAYVLVFHVEVKSYIMPLLQTVIAQGSGGFLVHNVPLWFVTCLFAVEIIYYFIAKIRPIWLRIAVCILSGLAGALMMRENSFFDFTLLPWSLEVAFAAIPFYALGNALIENCTHEEIVQKVRRNKILSAIVFIVSSVLLYIGAMSNPHVTMGGDYLNNFLIFYPTAVLGIISMLILCIYLSSLKQTRLYRFIQWFGENSFNAMAIHSPLKGFIIVIVAQIVHISTIDVSRNYLYSALVFIITLVITCICIEFVNRFKKRIRKTPEA